jgi:glyoxylase-like metal-dependent hydrolase (beta-lactamase superfamily II)
MNVPAAITITPVRVADLLAEGEPMPVYVHVIDHPDARVLVDTGMTELHPAVADLNPRLRPLSKQNFDLAGIDVVVNTHLHFDHCGGNHLFAGRPIYVQRRELDEPHNEGQRRVRTLDPELVWLAHEHEPWRPHTSKASRPANVPAPSRSGCEGSVGVVANQIRPTTLDLSQASGANPGA